MWIFFFIKKRIIYQTLDQPYCVDVFNEKW